MLQLETDHAKLRVAAARVVLEIAQAEFERTKIGSSYLLEKERPKKDAIRLESFKEQFKIRNELKKIHEKLAKDRVVSKEEILNQRLQSIEMTAQYREAEVALEQSEKGRAQSLRIAAATIREAELALEQRLLELQEHRIVAPVDGTIERRLVQEGEYNQTPGKPAFLLATGKWFEAYFDQSVIGKIPLGVGAQISLEAFAGSRLNGTVSKVHPFVSFSSAGPESTRPIRPSGTGAPEWPSTFSIQVELEDTDLPVVTGLSGLARITREQDVLAIPSDAIHSKSASRGVVLVPDGDGFRRHHVVLGASADGWTAVREGLTETDEIIAAGHLDLRPGDKIQVECEQAPLFAAQE